MKSKIGFILIGFVIHMLYLDFLAIKQHKDYDECHQNDAECLLYANSTYDRFYLKYFNMYSLLSYKNFSPAEWRME